MTIISIINQKGGVGKSTLAVSLCAALHYKFKKKILAIDLDPQGHLSLSYGINKDHLDRTIFNVLDIRYDGHTGIKDVAITLGKHFSLVPSNVKLSTLELILANRHGRESRLSNALYEDLKKEYDYIIIDCPPNLGLLTINALVASNQVIVPFDTSIYSLDGINYLNNTLAMLKTKINHDLECKYVLNNFDSTLQKNKNFLKNIKTKYPGKLFSTVVRKSGFFEESTSRREHIFKNTKAITAQRDIYKLAKEVIAWTSDMNRIATAAGFSMLQGTNISMETFKASLKNITFTIKAPNATDVRLAGTFNNWNSESIQLKKGKNKGTWHVSIPLLQGSKHQYKFIVDGNWKEDTSNKHKEKVFDGVYNSVIFVK